MSEAAIADPIRDRVKEIRRVPASTLVRNEKNWAKHPESQRAALRAVFSEVGFAIPNIGYELPDGRIKLIDGEARSNEAGDQIVPVAILDVTEAEADKLLATINPLGGMLEVNRKALGELLSGLPTHTAEMETALKTVRERLKVDIEGYLAAGDAPPEGLPTSSTRMVQLYFDPTGIEEFRRHVTDLSDRYDLDTTTDTVMEALRRAYAAN